MELLLLLATQRLAEPVSMVAVETTESCATSQLRIPLIIGAVGCHVISKSPRSEGVKHPTIPVPPVIVVGPSHVGLRIASSVAALVPFGICLL